MYIMDDGIRLDYVIEMPDGWTEGAMCPLVVIIHGFTGNKDERHIVGISRTLNESGFATLRADMYGHGKSDGEFANHTLYKWFTNAMTIIDFARKLPFASCVYLAGHSQGGLTACVAAGLKHEYIKGLILLSPALMIPEGARTGNLLDQQFDPENIPERITGFGQELDGNYVRAAQTVHWEEAVDKYKKPVLIVYATDEWDALKDSCKAAGVRYNDCTLVEIEHDDHCYDAHLDLVEEAVKEWILKQEK